jgi:sugar phosphate isomerase/epimerase
MRFGIIALQRGSLVPPGLSDQGALEHLIGLNHGEVVLGLAQAGFRTIELGGDLVVFFPHTFGAQAIADLQRVRRDHGLTYTVHLPLWSVEPSTPLESVRQGSVRAVLEILLATLPLEPEVYVLHATGALAAEFYRMDLPQVAKDLVLRQFQAKAHESLSALLEGSGIPSRKLAIETIEFPLDLTLELAQDLDLSLCLDTGHVLAGFSGHQTLDEAFEALLPRLAEVHLHDSLWQGPDREVAYGEDHRPLGEGDMALGRFLDDLSESGFAGPVIFELQVEQALRSIEVIRRLRPSLVQGWRDAGPNE